MRKGFPIYEEMSKYLVILYDEAVGHIWLCTRSLLNFLIYEENFSHILAAQAYLRWQDLKRIYPRLRWPVDGGQLWDSERRPYKRSSIHKKIVLRSEQSFFLFIDSRSLEHFYNFLKLKKYNDTIKYIRLPVPNNQRNNLHEFKLWQST